MSFLVLSNRFKNFDIYLFIYKRKHGSFIKFNNKYLHYDVSSMKTALVGSCQTNETWKNFQRCSIGRSYCWKPDRGPAQLCYRCANRCATIQIQTIQVLSIYALCLLIIYFFLQFFLVSQSLLISSGWHVFFSISKFWDMVTLIFFYFQTILWDMVKINVQTNLNMAIF